MTRQKGTRATDRVRGAGPAGLSEDSRTLRALEEDGDDDDGGLANEAPSFDWFDTSLTSSHPFIAQIAAHLAALFEAARGPRQRKPKAADRATLERIAMAVVSNLAVASLADLAAVKVSLRKFRQPITRYGVHAYRRVPELLDALSGQGMFFFQRSAENRVASTITPTDEFRRAIRDHGVTPGHFEQLPCAETIMLYRITRNHFSDRREREPIDYEDPGQTIAFRKEMATINDALRKADMRMLEDGGPPVLTFQRHLRRHFSLGPEDAKARFDRGGRLFGGWSQTLGSERRSAIRLDGEPIADLDFEQLFVRLAYLKGGLEPPSGDLYAGLPGLTEPHWRPGIKKAFNALLFRDTRLTKLPRGTAAHLPVTGARFREAVISRHPGIEPVLERGIGLHFFFLESQILIAAMLQLIEAGITAILPMHDGLMVAGSKADLAAKAMGDAAEKIVGFRLPVSRKG